MEHMVLEKIVWCWGVGQESSPRGSEICRTDAWASARWRGRVEYSRQRAQRLWISSSGKEQDIWGIEEFSVTRRGRKAPGGQRGQLTLDSMSWHLHFSAFCILPWTVLKSFCVWEGWWHAGLASPHAPLGKRSFQLLHSLRSVQHRAGKIVGAQ